MKTILFTALILASVSAFAKQDPASIGLQVLPNAKITSVQCWAPSNVSHDSAEAGRAQVLTEENDTVVMNILVSRFSDDMNLEAASLCKNLKAAARSGRAVDVIFEKNDEFIQDGGDFNIKGAVQLFGLNPLHNG